MTGKARKEMKRKHILYRDVADKIKEDIMSGHYPVGSFHRQKPN